MRIRRNRIAVGMVGGTITQGSPENVRGNLGLWGGILLGFSSRAQTPKTIPTNGLGLAPRWTWFRLQTVRELCAARLGRVGTALGRLWYGSKMRKARLYWLGLEAEEDVERASQTRRPFFESSVWTACRLYCSAERVNNSFFIRTVAWGNQLPNNALTPFLLSAFPISAFNLADP